MLQKISEQLLRQVLQILHVYKRNHTHAHFDACVATSDIDAIAHINKFHLQLYMSCVPVLPPNTSFLDDEGRMTFFS